MDNAADAAAIDRKRSKVEDSANAQKIVIQTLMDQQIGRKYLWDQLDKLNVFAQTLQFGRDGYAATAWAEGKRSVGLELMACITRLCPEQYLLMMRENSKQEIHDDRTKILDAEPADDAA